MSLLTRKRTLLAKIEGTYGTDPSPGSSDAMLVKNLNFTPINSELVSRDLIRPFLGNSQTLLAQLSCAIDFEVELAGAGIPGVAPAWGRLLRACAFSETPHTAAISITRSGGVATATLTAHGFSAGGTVRISGASQTEYNGDMVIASVPTADTFTFAVAGTPATPATGSPVVGTTVVYAPVSINFDSVGFYFNVDGIFHKVLGARGSAEFSINPKQIRLLSLRSWVYILTRLTRLLRALTFLLSKFQKLQTLRIRPLFQCSAFLEFWRHSRFRLQTMFSIAR
jgi:hypothetical protein